MQFSLSHSDKIIFCAVSGEEVGADIQELSQMEWRSLADRFYAPKEKELLHRISEEQEAKKRRIQKPLQQLFHASRSPAVSATM